MPTPELERVYSTIKVLIRFDPPETRTHALRELENAVEILRRAGYDAQAWGFSAEEIQ